MFIFSHLLEVGHQNFVPLRGGGSCFFLRNRVFISSGLSPLYFLTSPLKTCLRCACDLLFTCIPKSLEWSHLMVSSSKSFGPWTPCGGLKTGQASIRCLEIELHHTARVPAHHANILEEVVRFLLTCLEAVQSHPCSMAEGVA